MKTLLFGGAFVLATSATNVIAKEKQPNFIIILTDDQGYQDLGCFGSPLIKTPNIDKLANEGTRFTSFYAQYISGPSRTSLMTGCYHNRVARADKNYDGLHPQLDPSEITIAEILRNKGYSTCMVGKWDLAGHSQKRTPNPKLSPNNQGFDQSLWTPSGNDSGSINLYRDNQHIELLNDLSSLTKRYTDEAIDFIKHNDENPFFLYLAHTMPHTQLAASKEFVGTSKRGLYGDVMSELDYNVGRIIRTLIEQGLDKNTYVLYFSDNGPWWIKGEDGGSALPLRGAKSSTWDGGSRVPCIMWSPTNIPAGKVCDLPIATIDLLPTFATLAGGKTPSDRIIDGIDISNLIKGKQHKLDRAFFYYQHRELRAVRYGDWKLHLPNIDNKDNNQFYDKVAGQDRVKFKSAALYNIKNDISETNDLAYENPEKVTELMKLIEWARKDIGDYNFRGKNAR